MFQFCFILFQNCYFWKKLKQMEEIELFKLRAYLNYGYTIELQKRLKKKTGKTYSRAYIRKCLTYKHQNMIVIAEAIKYVEENELQKKYITKQLNRI